MRAAFLKHHDPGAGTHRPPQGLSFTATGARPRQHQAGWGHLGESLKGLHVNALTVWLLPREVVGSTAYGDRGLLGWESEGGVDLRAQGALGDRLWAVWSVRASRSACVGARVWLCVTCVYGKLVVGKDIVVFK